MALLEILASGQLLLFTGLTELRADQNTLDNLRAAKVMLSQELATEAANRLMDQAAGRGVKTTYSANGRSVDWNGYLRAMIEQICALDQCIALIEQRLHPYEIRSIART